MKQAILCVRVLTVTCGVLTALASGVIVSLTGYSALVGLAMVMFATFASMLGIVLWWFGQRDQLQRIGFRW